MVELTEVNGMLVKNDINRHDIINHRCHLPN